jgi:hypothetical protein
MRGEVSRILLRQSALATPALVTGAMVDGRNRRPRDGINRRSTVEKDRQGFLATGTALTAFVGQARTGDETLTLISLMKKGTGSKQ